MSSERLSFSYPAILKQTIKDLAKKENRSVSSMVQVFIKEGIEKRLKKEKETK